LEIPSVHANSLDPDVTERTSVLLDGLENSVLPKLHAFRIDVSSAEVALFKQHRDGPNGLITFRFTALTLGRDNSHGHGLLQSDRRVRNEQPQLPHALCMKTAGIGLTTQSHIAQVRASLESPFRQIEDLHCNHQQLDPTKVTITR
jgi:hypothetical protein